MLSSTISLRASSTRYGDALLIGGLSYLYHPWVPVLRRIASRSIAPGTRDAPTALRILNKTSIKPAIMVNALLSVVVYFLLHWHRVMMSFQVA
jgi:hypothetical protein